MCADGSHRDPALAGIILVFFFFFLLVIHGERSDQLDAFLKQKPHGVSNRRLLQTGVCDKQERLAQES